MPRTTHPDPPCKHPRAHVRAQRRRWIARRRRLATALFGDDPSLFGGYERFHRNPLTRCSCNLCSRRLWRRTDKRREQRLARAGIEASLE